MTGAARLALGGAGSLAVGFVTGPILARTLGPSGRGLLAAVAVPLGVAPIVLQIGTGAFALREAARGTRPSVVIGSVGAPLMAVGALSIVFAGPLAALFAGHHHTVETYLRLGFILMPAVLITNLLLPVISGLARWRALAWLQSIDKLAYLAAVVALVAAGALDLDTAALLTVVVGPAVAIPAVAAVWRYGRPRIEQSFVQRGFRYGLAAWPGTLASLANVRLDQVLMIRLVASRQLGLYVVAVTIAQLSGLLVGPIETVLMPRIAEGDHVLLARLVRSGLAMVFVISLLLAGAAPILIRIAFGGSFVDSIPLVWVLLIAGIPLAATNMLSHGLTATGHPGTTSLGELVSLGLTVPGLLLLLPPLGAMGAAITSVVAYSANFVILAWSSVRRLGLSPRTLLVIEADDARWTRDLLAARMQRLRMVAR